MDKLRISAMDEMSLGMHFICGRCHKDITDVRTSSGMKIMICKSLKIFHIRKPSGRSMDM